MTGIAGIIYPHLFQASELLTPMLKLLEHRGNEISDRFAFKNLQLGSTGQKIISNSKKTIFAVIDGKVYHDKQNIIESYETWGTDAFERWSGEFSVALFDKEKESLFLIRDRIGVKPLYWYNERNFFLFASEIKALLATGIVPQSPAVDGLASYFALGYIPQDLTPIEHINKLLPGHYLQFCFNKGVSVHSYWSYSAHFIDHHKRRAPLGEEELEEMLLYSIKDRIEKEKSTGCFLMGGVGSSTIARYAAKETNIQSFGSFFDGQNDRDKDAAQKTAELIGIPLEASTILPEEMLNDLLQIIWHLDEPLADPNVIATWNIAKQAKSKADVLFSGMGCDELFGIHTKYNLGEAPPTIRDKFTTWSTPLLKQTAPFLQKFAPKTAMKILRSTRANPWQGKYLRANQLFSSDEMARAAPDLCHAFDSEVFLNKFHHLDRIHSIPESFQYFDVKTLLPDCYIHQYERLTTANGLDWRTPFLDPLIIETLATTKHKGVLQKLLKKNLPKELIKRPKVTRRGFLSPWAKTANLVPLFRHLPFGTLVESGILSKEWIREQVQTEESIIRSFPKLWAIFTLEIWYRLFIQRAPDSPPPKTTAHQLIFEDV